jgi:hypothetical protein
LQSSVLAVGVAALLQVQVAAVQKNLHLAIRPKP